MDIKQNKDKIQKENSIDDPNDFSQIENIPNEELSYRSINFRVTGVDRLYSYFNAPIIKFLNHFVIRLNFGNSYNILLFIIIIKIFYIMFLIVFSGFLLFDYHPDQERITTVIRITVKDKTDFVKVTVTELIVIICVIIHLIEEIREVICFKKLP